MVTQRVKGFCCMPQLHINRLRPRRDTTDARTHKGRSSESSSSKQDKNAVQPTHKINGSVTKLFGMCSRTADQRFISVDNLQCTTAD
jgi:hypothetical protein